MDNFTSCEEYFENLRNNAREQNVTSKHIPYPHNNTEFWGSLDIIEDTKLLAYAVIMIVGLLGNISVIVTIVIIKSVRNAINFYIANLAVADALICVICMLPHALSQYTKRKFIFGAFMCKFTIFTQTTCLTSSVLTLSAISCDRFMAVFRPLQTRTTEKHTVLVIIVIWCISMAVSSPFLVVKKQTVFEWADFTEVYCLEEWPIYYYFNDRNNQCERRQVMREIYHMVLSLTLFFMPVLIMFGAYSAILYRLWTSQIPGENSEANNRAQSRSRNKVLKMVIIVLIVFVVCWTPLQVLFFIGAFGMDYKENYQVPSWYMEFEWFAYYIAYANSFINPFIYGQYNQDFRNGFCMILCCRRRTRARKRVWGSNTFTKSLRTMNTALSSLRNSTQAFFSRRISRNNDLELPETPV